MIIRVLGRFDVIGPVTYVIKLDGDRACVGVL